MIPIIMPERTSAQVYKGEVFDLTKATLRGAAKTPWWTRLILPFVPTHTVDVLDEWTIVKYKDFRGVRYIIESRRYV